MCQLAHNTWRKWKKIQQIVFYNLQMCVFIDRFPIALAIGFRLAAYSRNTPKNEIIRDMTYDILELLVVIQ